jgi:hypothetical protein
MMSTDQAGEVVLDGALAPTSTASKSSGTSFVLLRNTPILASLPETVVERRSEGAEQMKCARGDVICREGNPGDCMYIVERGSVEILVQRGLGEEVVVGKLGSGEFFGELALLDGQPRSATARGLAGHPALRVTRAVRTRSARAWGYRVAAAGPQPAIARGRPAAGEDRGNRADGNLVPGGTA